MAFRTALAGIRAAFSGVEQLGTEELAEKLPNPAILLLDCREPDEFAVSRLPGAEWIDPGGSADVLKAALSRDPPPTLVVCYCSIGYRSSDIAQKLNKLGAAPKAVNLEGSIFKWANEGRSLVDADGKPTTCVHPYNALWGKLLDRKHHKSSS